MSEQVSAVLGGTRGIAAATVTGVRGSRVDVRGAAFGVVSARLAVAGPYLARVGDAVLVAAADDGHYVIGVLRALRELSMPALTAEDGSRVSLEEGEAGPVWRLHDGSGRLLFEHGDGRSVVHVKEDLELRAGGDLCLSAAGAVRIESGESFVANVQGPLELTSSSSSPPFVADGIDGAAATSRLTLDGERASLSAPFVQLDSERADVRVTDANLVARTLRTVAHRVWEQAEVVERTSGRIVERAREVFREVEGLSQTKAGRLRLVADSALTLLGRHTQVRARETVKIDGEKVYLG